MYLKLAIERGEITTLYTIHLVMFINFQSRVAGTHSFVNNEHQFGKSYKICTNENYSKSVMDRLLVSPSSKKPCYERLVDTLKCFTF